MTRNWARSQQPIQASPVHSLIQCCARSYVTRIFLIRPCRSHGRESGGSLKVNANFESSSGSRSFVSTIVRQPECHDDVTKRSRKSPCDEPAHSPHMSLVLTSILR